LRYHHATEVGETGNHLFEKWGVGGAPSPEGEGKEGCPEERTGESGGGLRTTYKEHPTLQKLFSCRKKWISAETVYKYFERGIRKTGNH